MSVQDDLTAVERSLDTLVQAVGKLQTRVGAGLDVRRVRSDTDHLRESLALLRQSLPPGRPAKAVAETEMVPIPDTPYNAALWKGAEDDEGLGAKDRHAP